MAKTKKKSKKLKSGKLGNLALYNRLCKMELGDAVHLRGTTHYSTEDKSEIDTTYLITEIITESEESEENRSIYLCDVSTANNHMRIFAKPYYADLHVKADLAKITGDTSAMLMFGHVARAHKDGSITIGCAHESAERMVKILRWVGSRLGYDVE